ncbi:hypothetical protein DBR32_15015 [Taibaiella sp. KBW10]|nr:hypothetical protein DBR32_15015 [Taibaiella sp. KBW10]
MCCCIAGINSFAQQHTAERDSVGKVVAIDILLHEFCIAGDLYKVQKYKLDYPVALPADTLFLKCVATYKKTYEAIVPEKRSRFFYNTFYETVIPVVQYFRRPDLAQLFIEHQNQLHPKAPVPDLKHHEAHATHEHQ